MSMMERFSNPLWNIYSILVHSMLITICSRLLKRTFNLLKCQKRLDKLSMLSGLKSFQLLNHLHGVAYQSTLKRFLRNKILNVFLSCFGACKMSTMKKSKKSIWTLNPNKNPLPNQVDLNKSNGLELFRKDVNLIWAYFLIPSKS